MNVEPKPGEIVIEIDVERHERLTYTDNFTFPTVRRTRMNLSGNSQVRFPPANDFDLRSRWIYRRSPGTNYPGEVNQVDYIMGHYLHVDMDRRIGRISDPLGYESNKELWASLKALSSDLGNRMPLPDLVDAEPCVLDTDEKLWTWLFWMRVIVDKGCNDNRPIDQVGEWECRPIQNVHMLPSKDEILATRKAVFLVASEGNHQAKEWLNDLRRGKNADGRRMGEPEPGYNPDVDRDRLTPELFGIHSGAGV